MAKAGSKGASKQPRKKAAGGGSLPPGQLTQRLKSIPTNARDGVPSGGEGTSPLIFGLVLVLLAVGYVAWHFYSTLISVKDEKDPTSTLEFPTAPPQELTRVPISRRAMVTTYAYDSSGQYLVPFQTPTEEAADPLATIRTQLTERALPADLTPLLPEGSTLRDLRREGPLAIVDLPAATLQQAGSASGEQQLLGALTRALLSVEGIERVQFMVDGAPKEYTDNGVALDAPWTAESAGTLNPVHGPEGNTTGTFYFLSQSGNYLVPVSLSYPSGEGAMRAKIERLMEGPPTGSDLKPSIPPTLALDTIEYDAATGHLALACTTADLVQSWSLYNPGHLIRAIVLTLSEAAPIKELTFSINGTDVWSVEEFAKFKRYATDVDYFNPW